MNDSVKEKNKKFMKSFFKEWILPIIAAIIIAVLINKFLFFNVYIPSTSMVPTINKNDKLIVERLYKEQNIKRGDIIVFYSDELKETLIKRVIGLPGDKISIHDGIVNVNGTDLEEAYVKNNMNYNGDYEVPEDSFFFLGDNRSNSKDSRFWVKPYINWNNIKGKAVFRFYPISDIGSLK